MLPVHPALSIWRMPDPLSVDVLCSFGAKKSQSGPTKTGAARFEGRHISGFHAHLHVKAHVRGCIGASAR